MYKNAVLYSLPSATVCLLYKYIISGVVSGGFGVGLENR